MQLVVLGSGDASANPWRSAPGYLVASGETAVLLDCGSGTLQRIARTGLQPDALAAVFISHLHLDHWADLLALLFSFRVSPPCTRQGPLELHGGPGFPKLVAELGTLLGKALVPRHFDVECFEHENERFELGELMCQTWRLAHHPSSLALRLRAPSGASLAYLGDCALEPSAIAACRKADLAIVECSTLDANPREGHLHPAAIGELLRAAEPTHVILSHLGPDIDEAALRDELAQAGCLERCTIAFDGLGLCVEDD